MHNLKHIKHRACELVRTTLEDKPPKEMEFDDATCEYYHLGQTIALAPSGKSYSPRQAASLEPCPKCKGGNTVETCKFCGMTGSREYYEDRTFFKAAELEALKHGLYFFTLAGDAYMYKIKH